MAPTEVYVGIEPRATEIAATGVLTIEQIDIIVAFERAGAALSVLGVLMLLIAYATFKRLRTVPNTFIVFASIANLGASIACLIGYSGVRAGASSALCQAQAFMFELFMQSDPWWSFAMAVNVYMVFFFSANPRNFLSYWWAYFFVCYGIPFIPALWLLLVRSDVRGAVYGNATIWCWIDKDWSNLRIYTYYLPIWVCIFLSTCIYISVGYYVFSRRNHLRNLSLSNPTKEAPAPRDSGEKDLRSNAAFMGSVETEVVTTIQHESDSVRGEDAPVEDDHVYMGIRRALPTVTRITANPRPRETRIGRLKQSYRGWFPRLKHLDPVKLAYLRTSFVFAISVLVTWTPSSINRLHDLFTVDMASFGLNLASGIVLPLQGVWNALIFFTTSWKTLKQELRVMKMGLRGVTRGHQEATAARDDREREIELERRLGRKRTEGDSEASGSTTIRVIRDGSF